LGIEALNSCLELREAGLCQPVDLLRGQEIGLHLGEKPDSAIPVQFAKRVENVLKSRVGVEHGVHEPDFIGTPIHKNAHTPVHFRCIEEGRLSSQVSVTAIAAVQRTAPPCFKIRHTGRVRLPTGMTGRGKTLLKGNIGGRKPPP